MSTTLISVSSSSSTKAQIRPPESNTGHTNLVSAIVKECFCDNCGKVSTKRCIGCKRIYFCNSDCQKKAWTTHQTICKNTCLIPADDEIVCKFKDPTHGVIDITQKIFKEKMKATYVCAPIFSNIALEQTKASSDNTSPRQSHSVSNLVALEYLGGKIGYGLVALKDIPKNTTLSSFGGMAYPADLWDAEKKPQRAQLYCIFVMGRTWVFDPSNYMSLGAIINEGPPNTEFTNVPQPTTFSDTVKIPANKVAITTRDIKEGECIYAEYHPEHAVRNAFYNIEEKTLCRLMQTYSSDLDISLLNQTGWIANSVNHSNSETIDIVKLREIQYILTTPYLLAVLHLRTNLNPAKTLKNLNKLSPEIYAEYPKQLDRAKIILKCLITLPKKETEALLDIVEQISQSALIWICTAITNLNYSMKDFKTLGKFYDTMILLFSGTYLGSYWDYSEEKEFRKKFLTPEHQRAIFDDFDIHELPKDLILLAYIFRAKLYKEVWKHLSPSDQALVKSYDKTGRLVKKTEEMVIQ